MNETIFWNMIEQAWDETSPTLKAKRFKIAVKQGFKEPSELGMELSDVVASDLLDNLTEKLKGLSQADLLAFDRILEQKLYDLDRANVQAYTDGSDDGFLYCRGFIVGMGKEYYDLIYKESDRAMADLEAESFCYFPMHLYTELYGDFPASNISRETASNQAGWEEA